MAKLPSPKENQQFIKNTRVRLLKCDADPGSFLSTAENPQRRHAQLRHIRARNLPIRTPDSDYVEWMRHSVSAERDDER